VSPERAGPSPSVRATGNALPHPRASARDFLPEFRFRISLLHFSIMFLIP
jgi:hypothetical protein